MTHIIPERSEILAHFDSLSEAEITQQVELWTERILEAFSLGKIHAGCLVYSGDGSLTPSTAVTTRLVDAFAKKGWQLLVTRGCSTNGRDILAIFLGE